MARHRIQRFVWILLLALFALSGCASPAQPVENPSGESQSTVTDLLGRQVGIPEQVQHVVAIGPGALRLYVYAGSLDALVGVEQMETGEPTGKPYLIANPDLSKLPEIGLGGPNNAPDPEKLLAVEPDVIFSTYAADAAAADELQTKTGIPVVVLSYGKTALFDPKVDESLLLIGKITGQEAKAQAAVNAIKQFQQDLEQRTAGIDDSAKPSVYVGALGAKGTHGIESTQGNYTLLNAIKAINVVDETEKTGSVMVDKEKLLDWDPDVLIIDQGGYAAVLEDYQKNSDFYQALSAVKNGQIYAQLPYNYYSTNIDTAIADCYYLGSVIYPEAFADVDPAKKADEIYQALLGAPVYERMAQDFGGFRSLTLE